MVVVGVVGDHHRDQAVIRRATVIHVSLHWAAERRAAIVLVQIVSTLRMLQASRRARSHLHPCPNLGLRYQLVSNRPGVG